MTKKVKASTSSQMPDSKIADSVTMLSNTDEIKEGSITDPKKKTRSEIKETVEILL